MTCWSRWTIHLGNREKALELFGQTSYFLFLQNTIRAFPRETAKSFFTPTVKPSIYFISTTRTRRQASATCVSSSTCVLCVCLEEVCPPGGGGVAGSVADTEISWEDLEKDWPTKHGMGSVAAPFPHHLAPCSYVTFAAAIADKRRKFLFQTFHHRCSLFRDWADPPVTCRCPAPAGRNSNGVLRTRGALRMCTTNAPKESRTRGAAILHVCFV